MKFKSVRLCDHSPPVSASLEHAVRIFLTSVLLAASNPGVTQDIRLTNARIVDGNGGIVDRGAILVQGGRIVSVSADSREDGDTAVIDIRGMTVVPGLIDTHVHTMAFGEGMTSDAAVAAYIEDHLPGLLQGMIEAGVTTVLDTGAYFPAILGVREQLAEGRLPGPRLLVAGPVFSAPAGHPAVSVCRDNPFCREHMVRIVEDPETARAHVAELAKAGVDIIKAVHQAGSHLPIMDETIVAAIAAESEAQGVPFYVHGTYFSGMLRAARLGVDGFVHIPWRDQADRSLAKDVFADAGIPIATTVSLHDTVFDAEGVRRTANGGRFPPAQDDDRARAVANAGVFREAGVTLAFGTDMQPMRPYSEAIIGEAQALAEVMTPAQVISVLTRNSAIFLDLGDEIGTLEPGKLADMVIVDGDPLADISDLGNVVLVIQSGRIVIDHRPALRR